MRVLRVLLAVILAAVLLNAAFTWACAQWSHVRWWGGGRSAFVSAKDGPALGTTLDARRAEDRWINELLAALNADVAAQAAGAFASAEEHRLAGFGVTLVTQRYSTPTLPAPDPRAPLVHPNQRVLLRAGWPWRALGADFVTVDGPPRWRADARRLLPEARRPALQWLPGITALPDGSGIFAGDPGTRPLPARILWPGFLANTALLAVALLVGAGAARALRRILRRHRGRCPRCAYPRAGLHTGAACPECGAR